MKKDKSVSLIAIPFSKGFFSPNLPIATFHQGDTELNFILDTGSNRNSIDKQVLEKLEYEKVEDSNTINLSGVGGSQQAETYILKFSHGEEEYTDKFLVIDFSDLFKQIRDAHGIPVHGIIGTKFLKRNKIVIDFDKYVAYNKEAKQ